MREVTGERIRDKIAASKAKGMWMGGNLALGYDPPTDPITRALVINPVEAETVQLIFRRYLEPKSVSSLCRWLAKNGVVSKSRVTRRGKTIGGAAFNRGALFHLLKNRLYLGEIPHKDRGFPGAHTAIIDQTTFDAAQALLASHAPPPVERIARPAPPLLKGLIHDADGSSMSPVAARSRHGKIYCYYVSAPLLRGSWAQDQAAVSRVPADLIDSIVLDRVAIFSRSGSPVSPQTLRETVVRVEVDSSVVRITGRLKLKDLDDAARELDRARRTLRPDEALQAHPTDPRLATLTLQVCVRRRGGRTWLHAQGARDPMARANPDPTLIAALRSAHAELRAQSAAPYEALEVRRR